MKAFLVDRNAARLLSADTCCEAQVLPIAFMRSGSGLLVATSASSVDARRATQQLPYQVEFVRTTPAELEAGIARAFRTGE